MRSNRENILNQIIKSPKSVKIIATGKITEDLPKLRIYFMNGKQINGMFEKYSGKSGTLIFIEDKEIK